MTSATQAALRRTPLFEAHVAAGAKMVPFGGWEMPLHYGSQIEEHMAARNGVTLFDVSHMGEVEVTGAGALALANQMTTRDLKRLTDGQEAYGVLVDDDGGLIDDLIFTRFGPEEFFAVVNASAYEADVERMKEIAGRAGIADAVLRPCADEWAMIAVQGPQWIGTTAAAIGEGSWRDLKPYHAVKLTFGGERLIVSTTGYTGEPGCELLCAPEQATALWDALVEGGGVPAGLAARDTLRLEKGMCLSGQDFTRANNPFEARLGWVVDTDKESFPGQEALERIRTEGVRQRLIGLLPEGRRIPRHGARVLAGGEAIGEVTSGGFSPCLKRPIALAYVKKAFAKKGTELEIDLGRARIKSLVSPPPFYPPKV